MRLLHWKCRNKSLNITYWQQCKTKSIPELTAYLNYYDMPQTTASKILQQTYWWPTEYTSLYKTQACTVSILESYVGVHESFRCKERRRQLPGACHIFHKVCVPATLNHSLEELVLPTAPSLTLDKLEKYTRLWRKDNSGGQLSSFLLALVVYQFSVTDGTSSFCLNMLDYLWMTGQLRREYCGWPRLKSVTLIKSCTEMSAWQSIWNHQRPDFDPTVTYLQINSVVLSKTKILCLKNRIKRLERSQYRKCKEKLSPLYPQLLNTSLMSVDGRFAQKKKKIREWNMTSIWQNHDYGNPTHKQIYV